MESLKRSKRTRKIEVVSNPETIKAADLPKFGQGNAKHITPPGQNEQKKTVAHVPTFDSVAGTLDGKKPVQPAIDFAALQAKQRQSVEQQIAADEASRDQSILEDQLKNQETPIIVREGRVDIEAPVDPNYTYQRVYLPSRGLLDIDALFIRPLDTPDILNLSAIRKSKDQTSLFDIMGGTIKDYDIRKLSKGDFQFVFYWLRMNSYTRNPFTITWTSKYGNENKTTLKTSDLKITPLNLDPDDIVYFESKGFCCPTLRDGEAWSRYIEKMPEADKEALEYKAGYAQYVQGSSVEEKLAKLAKFSPDDMVEIMEFSALLNHGVVESMEVRDANFDADEALDYLKTALTDLDKLDLSSITRDDIRQMLIAQRTAIEAEIIRIETDISNTGEAAASSETITFSLSLDDFFPENINARDRVRAA